MNGVRHGLALALLLLLAGSALALKAGEPLPQLNLKAGKDMLNSAELKGQVVYLDFWASWCGPCKESFPFMESLQKEFAKDSLVVLAVNLDRKSAAASEFLKTRPVSFRVAYDPKGVSAEACGVSGMPTCLLVDRAGIVREIHTGFREDESAALRTSIRSLLEETR